MASIDTKDLYDFFGWKGMMMQEAILKPYTHAVIVEYDYSDRARGDVISKHKSYAAAAKKASQSTFWAVREIAEVSINSLAR